jgi:two-component system phosphate regulon response regulator PhoB
VAKGTILVIEDEEDIQELVRYHLERDHYRVLGTKSGEEGLEIAKKESPDLVLLDLMLPGMDGLEVCRALRADAQTRTIPIVMLTARTEEADVVSGLEIGADDYITKPFRPRVLVARLRAVLRRRSKEADGEPTLSYRDLRIDFARHEVRLRGNVLPLTLTEFKIIAVLAQAPGRVFSRYQILDGIRGQDSFVLDRTIDVHMAALRKKLGSYAGQIETVRGVGYRLKDV